METPKIGIRHERFTFHLAPPLEIKALYRQRIMCKTRTSAPPLYTISVWQREFPGGESTASALEASRELQSLYRVAFRKVENLCKTRFYKDFSLCIANDMKV